MDISSWLDFNGATVMVEVIVALIGAAVGVVASLVTTSFKVGSEKQAREDLSQRHAELAKELRNEVMLLKAERDHLREKIVTMEKDTLTLAQRLDATQSQLATRGALETERLEHLRQAVEAKASSEMVSGMKSQLEKIDQKLEQLIRDNDRASANSAGRVRPRK